MKSARLLLLLTFLFATAFAQQTMRPDGMGGWVIQDQSGCGGLFGAAQGACIANQQRLMQQQIQQQQQILQQQQFLQQQQLENQRLQNELLRRKLQQEPPVDYSQTPEFRDWLSENQWYGADRAKTEFALLYAKQLRQERPDLIGRPFFDAVSAKVNDTFGASR